MLAMADRIDFSTWLDNELLKRNWSQSELARRAGVTRSGINGVIIGSRNPGTDLCEAIARALRLPPEEVFRAAGILPPVTPDTRLSAEMEYLLARLTPARREEVLNYIRFLAQQEEGNPVEPPSPAPVAKSTLAQS